MRALVITLLATAMLAGTAHADTFEGNVTNVDVENQKLTFTRSDTRQEMVVKVDQKEVLNQIQPGTPVRVEANKQLLGGWSASSIQIPQY